MMTGCQSGGATISGFSMLMILSFTSASII
jgi:hypothetical protein